MTKLAPTRVQKHLPCWKWLLKTKRSTAKAFIQAADKNTVNGLCECCLNILKGNVPLTSAQKRRLGKHKQTLRLLARKKRLSLRVKKKALLQKGGFLGALLGPIISTVGSLLLGGLTRKN